MTLGRTAVIAYHSSPLIEPGSGDAGGMTVYVREVAERLARRGISTDIFTRATGPEPRVVELCGGVRVISIEAGPLEPVDKEEQRRYIGGFTNAVRAFATTQRIAYDLVHSHYWQSGVAARSLAVAWGVPLVHSHHTLGRVKNHYLAPGDVPEPPERMRGEAEVIAGAEMLVASTDDEWEQLACFYGADHDRISTVHPGVDHEVFTPGDRAAARRALGLAGDELVALYVGRIQRLKGIELAIRAVEQLLPVLDRPLALLVVGGASGRNGRREMARLRGLAEELDVGHAVRFLGPQPHDDLPVFYRAADALVVCSHSESFGLTALEAHACGTPVVGTAVGGLSYIVCNGSSGFLVPTRDPSVFAAKLEVLLSDDDLRASFRAKAVRAAARFSWDRTADELLELYECLIHADFPEVCTC